MAKVVQAGKLDRRVTLRFPGTPTVSNSGQQTFSSPVDETVWAAKVGDPRKPAEEVRDMTMSDESYENWMIRWRNDITAQVQVIEADGTIYEVESKTEMGRKSFLILRCKQFRQG